MPESPHDLDQPAPQPTRSAPDSLAASDSAVPKSPQPLDDCELVRLYARGRDVTCPSCRYPMRDSPEGRCPECGRIPTIADLVLGWRVRRTDPRLAMAVGIASRLTMTLVLSTTTLVLVVFAAPSILDWCIRNDIQLIGVIFSACGIAVLTYVLAIVLLRMCRAGSRFRARAASRFARALSTSAPARPSPLARLGIRRLKALALPPMWGWLMLTSAIGMIAANTLFAFICGRSLYQISYWGGSFGRTQTWLWSQLAVSSVLVLAGILAIIIILLRRRFGSVVADGIVHAIMLSAFLLWTASWLVSTVLMFSEGM